MKSGTGARRADTGLSLIELLITMGLSLIVITILGGIFLSTTTTQISVSGATDATAAGELVNSSLGREISNSQVSFNASLTPSTVSATFRISTVSSKDQLLAALVVGAGQNYSEHCAAWYYSASERTIRSTTRATAIAFPSVAEARLWTLLASGVSAPTGSEVFRSVPNPAKPASLHLAFAVDSPQRPAVLFDTLITSRTGLYGSQTSCY